MKRSAPRVVTANLLRTGDVVYLADGGRWVRQLADAAVAATPDDLGRLEQWALASVTRSEVVSVYAFDVALVDGHPSPVSVRERIRAAHAPTV